MAMKCGMDPAPALPQATVPVSSHQRLNASRVATPGGTAGPTASTKSVIATIATGVVSLNGS
jgi:hypothetical protein